MNGRQAGLPDMITSPPRVARASATINRERRPGLDVTTVERPGLREVHITLRALRHERPSATIRRLVATLEETGATPVHLDAFGSLAAYREAVSALERMVGRIAWPLMWTEDRGGEPVVMSGMHILAVSGTEVRPIEQQGQIVGCAFHDGCARHCMLGGVTPETLSAPVQAQSTQLHEGLFELLREAGMAPNHVARTRFSLANLPAAYGAFNRGRDNFCRRHPSCAELTPTSTCIGARNPAGAAIMASAWAIQPTSQSTLIQTWRPSFPGAAPRNNSCVSRAVEVTSPDYRRLLLSATASPGAGNRPGAIGGPQGQVDQAMRRAEAMLTSRDFSLLDVTRATVYLKHAADASAFTDWCVRHDALFLPVLVVQSATCRKDSLVEIELDAIAPTARRLREDEHAHARKRGPLVSVRRKTWTCRRDLRRFRMTSDCLSESDPI